jgi:hypothetical protein
MSPASSTLSFSLPNLYSLERRGLAETIYALLVSHLSSEHRDAEAVLVCRRIRSFGRRSLPPKAWRQLHLDSEIRALVRLGKPDAAWHQYRLWLRHYPKHVRLRTVEERVRNGMSLVPFYEVPIRYWSGQWEVGRKTLEAYLKAALEKKNSNAYDLLFSIYNSDFPEPRDLVRVTLWHLYAKLGRRIDAWKDWGRWVGALHPALFRTTRLERDALLTNSDLLPTFFGKLMKERDKRSRSSGVSFGQRDFVDNPGKVERRHADVRQRRESWRRKRTPLRQELDEKVPRYFPFIVRQ